MVSIALRDQLIKSIIFQFGEPCRESLFNRYETRQKKQAGRKKGGGRESEKNRLPPLRGQTRSSFAVKEHSKFQEFTNQLALKVGTLIRMDPFWKAKNGKNLSHSIFATCLADWSLQEKAHAILVKWSVIDQDVHAATTAILRRPKVYAD